MLRHTISAPNEGGAMKDSLRSTQLVAALLAIATASLGCSDDSAPSSTSSSLGGAGAASPSTSGITTAVARGWASVWPGDGTRVTNGGNDADAGHVYTVTNRSELVQALYPDAVIADNGTFASELGPDVTPKIIYVQGRISLNTNAAGRELSLADHACEGYDFAAFKAAYEPREWNKQPLDGGAPPEILPCPGSQEELRQCSVRRQRAVVELKVGSNTSFVGLGADAKIVHGGIVVGGAVPRPPVAPGSAPAIDADLAEACGIELGPQPAPAPPATPAPAPELSPVAENVIVRNITFEDAFDMFPAWDPGDSYSAPPAVANPQGLNPHCQATYDATSDNGPQQCAGGRWNSEYDTLRVQNASHVWIDHCTFSDGDRESQSASSVWEPPYDGYRNRVESHDGALDINGYADFVTVSQNVFMNHDKVMLIGSSDTVRATNGWGALSVTVDHNRFSNCGQRLPRVRFGKVHVYSNYIEGELSPVIAVPEDFAKPMPAHPLGSAIGVGHLAKLYSENNVYALTAYPGDPAPDDQDAVLPQHRATPTEGSTPDVNEHTYFFDSGSVLNGAATNLIQAAQEQAMRRNLPELLSTDAVWSPSATYKYTLTAAKDVKSVLDATAGAGKLH
jgi:pectate lyase